MCTSLTGGLTTIQDGESPRIPVVNRKLYRIYVTTAGEEVPPSRLSVINGATNRIIKANIRLGLGVSAGVVNENTNRVNFVNEASNRDNAKKPSNMMAFFFGYPEIREIA